MPSPPPKFEEREPVVLLSQGQKLFGVIHRPLSVSPAPAVLVCHGFAGHKCGKYRLYVKLAEKLAREGIACLRIDFRGSGDSEGSFSEMSLEGEVADTLEALRYLDEEALIDSSRIGLLGRSLGGIVAVLAARRFGRVKSLVLWAPAFNAKQWQTRLSGLLNPEASEVERDELMRFEGSRAGEAFIREFFNLSLEEELKELERIPLLHIHGEVDSSVDLSHAEAYERLRRNASGETRHIRLPHTDHQFTDVEERRFTVEETCRWFVRTL